MNPNNGDNSLIDLSGRLKNSNVGLGAVDDFQRRTNFFQKNPPKIVQWVIQYSNGAIKDEDHANYVLLGFVVVVIGISVFLFSGLGIKSPKPPVTKEKMMESLRQTENELRSQ